MKKYCPIVKINLPYDQGMYAHLYYCDTHSLTIEVFPTNEHHIARLTEGVMKTMKDGGCKIHPQIKEYELYDWLKNKETYLKDISDFNNLTKEELRTIECYDKVDANQVIGAHNLEILDYWMGCGLI